MILLVVLCRAFHPGLSGGSQSITDRAGEEKPLIRMHGWPWEEVQVRAATVR